MNFQYYKTGPLIIMIAVLIVLAHIIIAVTSPMITAIIPNRFAVEFATIADYLGVFSVLGLVSLILAVIDHWAWKFSGLQWLVDVPDLSGRYKGVLMSDYNGLTKKEAVIEVCQTASKIKICSYFADHNSTVQTSSSCSLSEVLIKKPNGKFSLVYLFANSPSHTMNQVYQHEGTITLDYHQDIKTLNGEYYNKRKNHGTLEVIFEGSKLLGRFKR